ncbi:MAG: hypothetical protein EP343_19415 [Deltaproteobacteria bacterium]|nr:MAG: hypothetical protein EP343_19415 [Deltaproteobacteria bacterium]
MRRWQRWTLGLGAVFFGITSAACSNVGSFTKAPITKLATGGTVSARQQQFMLRRLKWEHRGLSGKITGLSYFTDTYRPIAGARSKDTLTIHKGPFKGDYGIKRVIRLVDTDRRGKRRRQVVVEITGQFFDPSQAQYWKTFHKGTGGISLKENIFTDSTSFLPEVPVGTVLVVVMGGQERRFTVMKTLASKFGLRGLQRVGYVVREPLPTGLKNLNYRVLTPTPGVSDKLKYHIRWAGSGLSGHNFTLGINRRRYNQNEVDALLRSTNMSKKKLSSVGAKRSAAIVFQVTGAVAAVIGGFLALVRRDDFPGAQQAIPWSIAGGGVALLLAAIPLNVSANNDYLNSAQAYNKDLIRRLKIQPPRNSSVAEKSDSKKNDIAPGPAAAPSAKANR